MTRYMFDKVRKLINEGMSNSGIARKLSIDRKTVAKYRSCNTPPRYTPRTISTRVDYYAPFASKAETLIKSNDDLTASEIFALIQEEGYKGCERTVQRRVSNLHGHEPKERFFEQEYEPGEQSQFDFKESVVLPFLDGERTCHLHFGTLPFSGKFHIRGYPFKAYEAFMDGVHSFFEFIGGMTENIRIDNLSPCIAEILTGSRRNYTAAFQRAIDYYGFGVLPCRPATGSDKGDVERDIRTHARRFHNLIKLTGRVFSDWDDLNTFLLEYCIRNQGEKSTELQSIEVKTLRQLPAKDDAIISHTDTIRCNSHGMLRIDRCKASYSAPDHAIGKWCHVIVTPFDVRIFEKSPKLYLIAYHARQSDGKHSILLEHILPSLVRKPGALLRWKHRDILFVNPSFKRYYAYVKDVDAESADREFLLAANLIQYAQMDEIAVAMEIVISAKSSTPFEDLKQLLLISKSSASQSSHLDQTPLTPELSGYDSLIPNYNSEIAS